MWAVIAIQAALLRRHRSGRGGMVDVSLYETALSWMTVPAAQYQGSGNLPGKHGSGAEMIAPYRAYQTSDGHMVVAAGNNNLFRLLAHALSHPEWATDERFADNPQRVVNRHVLDQLIESCMHVQTNAHWSECLTRAGVPVAPVQNIAQVIESEQTQALDMLQVVPGTNMTLMGLPIRFDGQRPSIRHAAPALNADAKVLQAYSEGALGT
jgi:crotonobetainyl-CoA:carnitine CoA-transferase CaiB-like acyl-CoA transferase